MFVYTWTGERTNNFVHWSIRNCVERFDWCRHHIDCSINLPHSSSKPCAKTIFYLKTNNRKRTERKRNNNTLKLIIVTLYFANHAMAHECHYRHLHTFTHTFQFLWFIYLVTEQFSVRLQSIRIENSNSRIKIVNCPTAAESIVDGKSLKKTFPHTKKEASRWTI